MKTVFSIHHVICGSAGESWEYVGFKSLVISWYTADLYWHMEVML